MSFSKDVMVDCPKCKKRKVFKVWYSVNVTEDFKLRDMVFSGEIFTFTCDECKAKAFIAYPMIYHDYERRFFIYFNPDNKFENLVETEGYVTKKTSDYLEMLEMIKIFEDEVSEEKINELKNKLLSKLKEAKSDKLKEITDVYYSGKTDDKTSFYVPQIKSTIDIGW